ncbi:MAG TPA: carboxypeptidase regulatory-like domain-containing protein [Candidatus Methylomirabilis sp.]|nr:carboxypeptidase regulatory-like domain-containing protein [Candidatus Methylomirabilis sp.]
MLQRSAWFLFSLLVFVLSPAFGQSMGGMGRKALSGHIREEGTGHGIGSAQVVLQNSSGTPIATVYSDSNGAYNFDDIGQGDVYVIAQHDGYTTVKENVHPDGAPETYKDVYLAITSTNSAAPPVKPVSEHELSVPRKAREDFDKGIQLIVTKSDYRRAVAQFSRAISAYPDYYEAYAAMGLAQDKMGDAGAAENALRKSIELSSEKYPQAMIDLASLLNGKKRFAEAEPLLHKAIALDISSWRAQSELAAAQAGQNHFREALASASASRDLQPDNPQIYLALYNLHIETDNFAAAVADADAYLKLKPEGPTADKVRKMREQVHKALQDASSANPAKPPTSR